MERKYIILLVTSIVIISIAVCCVIFFNGNPIETEEEATEIAKAYVLKKYNNNFEDYEISTLLESDVWIVSYSIPPVFDDNGEILEVIVGGGGPMVRIKKSNGKVVYCMLQM